METRDITVGQSSVYKPMTIIKPSIIVPIGTKYSVTETRLDIRSTPSTLESTKIFPGLKINDIVIDQSIKVNSLMKTRYGLKWLYVYSSRLGKYGWVLRSGIKVYTSVSAYQVLLTSNKASTPSTGTTTTIIDEIAPTAAAAMPVTKYVGVSKVATGAVSAATSYSKSIVYNVITSENAALDTSATEINGTKGVFPNTLRLPDNYGTETAQGKRFKMVVYTVDSVTKSTVVKTFTMNVGPTAYTQSYTNTIAPIKTGGGFVLCRGGQELSRMQLSGVMLDTKESDERRQFLDNYYNKYLVDKVNAFHEYFNDNRLVIELNGYRYEGILLNLSLSKNAQSLYLYTYNMEFIVTNSKAISTVQTIK